MFHCQRNNSSDTHNDHVARRHIVCPHQLGSVPERKGVHSEHYEEHHAGANCTERSHLYTRLLRLCQVHGVPGVK